LRKEAMQRAAEKVHFELPVRSSPCSSGRTLFPSTVDTAENGANTAGHSDDVKDASIQHKHILLAQDCMLMIKIQVDMDYANDNDDERPEWRAKGYTYPDAEDPTQINGCKIVGGSLTLTGMIRQYMQKGREKEREKKEKEAGAAFGA
jgi:hypothetical protein